MLKNTYKCKRNDSFDKINAIKFVRGNLMETPNLVDAKYFVEGERELSLSVKLVNSFKAEALSEHGLTFMAVGVLPCELLNRDIDRAVKAIRKASVRAIDNRNIQTAIELLNVMQRVIDIQV